MNISKIINEAFKSFLNEEQLEEAAINPLVYTQIDNMINKMTFVDAPENLNENFVKKEMKDKMHFKLNKIQHKEFGYNNFHIVKLGSFALKQGEGVRPLIFHIEGQPNNASYFYLYVWNEKVKIIYYASSFYENDTILIKNANEFIKGQHIN